MATHAVTDNWVDAQEMQRNFSDTFAAPTVADIRKLEVGQYVKICNGEERFWVEVTQITATTDPMNDTIWGLIVSQLVGTQSYGRGDHIVARGCHVYDIA